MAMKFEELPPSAQKGLIAGLAALLAGLAFWYFVLPLSRQRETLETQVKDLEAQNLRNRAFEQQRTVYLRRIAEAQKELDVLRTIVPDEPDTDGFIRMMHEAEAGAAVHVRTLTAQPMASEALYMALPFKMGVDGTYYGLLDFFDRLAHHQRIVNVTDLSLGSPQGAGKGTYTVAAYETVGASCVITTYFNRPQAAATPPSKPAK